MDTENCLNSIVMDSVPVLISRLCELHIEQSSKKLHWSVIHASRENKQRKRRSLKSKAFETIFRYLKDHPLSSQTTKKVELTPFERMYGIVFLLRCQRRFDDACRLEKLLKSVSSDKSPAFDDTITTFLKFLLCLENSAPSTSSSLIGHSQAFVHIANTGKLVDRLVLPPGPLNYGDTKVEVSNSFYYMHFPREVFEVQSTDIISSATYPMLHSSIFATMPGSSVFSGVTSAKSHSTSKSSDLFGALYHSKVSNLDVELDFPSLPDVPEFTLPRPQSRWPVETSMDEGYADSMSTSTASPCQPLCEMSSSLTEDGNGGNDDDDDDVWTKALRVQLVDHYTWEVKGRVPVDFEKPYLTEAGRVAFDHMRKLYLARLQMINPLISYIHEKQISMDQLVVDSIYLLLGIPSNSFVWQQDRFVITDGLYVSGLSPESVQMQCRELLDCGTYVHRLGEFSLPRVPCSTEAYGQVLEAFRLGLRQYLQSYRAGILSFSTDSASVLRITHVLRKLIAQIRFLARLCHLDTIGGPTLPTGHHLVSYLYEECLVASSSLHYPVLLSLLLHTSEPYLCMVRDWLFRGICRDSYGEFMLRIDHDCLARRDEHYWTRSYLPVEDDVCNSLPTILKDLASEIFICGKSLNLLKTCSGTEHFLVSEDYVEVPPLKLVLTTSSLLKVRQDFTEYFNGLRVVAERKIKTRAEVRRKAELAKLELQARVRRIAAERLKTVQQAAIEAKAKVDARKRQLFSEFKQQMEQDLQQRIATREAERAADEEYIKNAHRQELLEANHDTEVVRKAKEELVEHYARLSKEAMLREQKAQWRIRRHKLDDRRVDFLQLAANDWSSYHDGDLVVDAAPTLADQANSSWTSTPDLTSILRQSGDQPDDANLQENLTVTDTTTNEHLRGTDVDLPRWAVRGLHQTEISKSASGGDFERKSDIGFHENAGGDELSRHCIKIVPDQHHSKTSLPTEERIHSRAVASCSVSDETAERPSRAQVKSFPGRHVTDESDGFYLASDRSGKPTAGSVVAAGGEAFGAETVLVSEEKECGQETLVSTEAVILPAELRPVVENRAVRDGSFTTSDKETDSTEDFETTCEVHDSRRTESSHVVAVSGDDSSVRSHVAIADKRHVSQQSSEKTDQPHIRFNPLVSSVTETSEIPEKLHIRYNPDFNSVTETTEAESKSSLKPVEGKHSSLESTDDGNARKPCIRLNEVHSSTTESVNSHDSMQVEFGIHRLKRSVPGHANVESMDWSEFSSYQVRRVKSSARRRQSPDEEQSDDRNDADGIAEQQQPQRRQVEDRDDVMVAQTTFRPGIKMSQSMGAMTESAYDDRDVLLRQRFLRRNVHGHSSDSSVQRLLYGGGEVGEEPQTTAGEHDVGQVAAAAPATGAVLQSSSPWLDEGFVPYEDKYDCFDKTPNVDVMSWKRQCAEDDSVSKAAANTNYSDLRMCEITPLSVIVDRCVLSPIRQQVALVNDVIVDYFMVDLELNSHFVSLHRYLLLQDGEFSQTLTDQLFEKLSEGRRHSEFLNPMYLNSLLHKALASSANVDSRYTSSISFILKHGTKTTAEVPDALDRLELDYRVNWPLNLVITDSVLRKYKQIFSFMLKLKRAVWTLKGLFHRLKRDGLQHTSRGNCQQTHTLHAYRHEMQHVVKVLHEYIANQVVSVLWHEFQTSLERQINGLDELRQLYNSYVNKSMARCLLSRQAAPVLKIINSMFGLILTFTSQLTSQSWQFDAKTRQLRHPAFDCLSKTYAAFHQHSVFLFKVVDQLSAKSYQPHFQELMIRLNFNGFYKPVSAC